MKRIVALLALAVLSSPILAAQGQIEFVAKIVSVNIDPTDPDTGILEVSVLTGVVLNVLVNHSTETQDEDGDPISLSEISPGTFVKVEGIFTAGGILALEISVGSESLDFTLRGRIEVVRAAVREIEVKGFVIDIPVEAEIKDISGNPLVFEDLEVDQLVKIEGSLVEDRLVAAEVKLITPEATKARVRFEGIVTDMDENTLDVSIEGLGPVRVVITPETDIEGDLAVGKLVRVWGRLDSGLAVEARRIVVLPFVRLAPSRLNMRFEETKVVHVVLQALQEEDVELTFSTLAPEIAEPAVPSLLIPAGTLNSTFEVVSKTSEGTTTIEVGLPAGLGGGHRDLLVSVRDRPVREGQTQRIHWIPSKLNLATDDQARVVLQLAHPAEEEIRVELALKEGSTGLVFPDHVVFPVGEKRIPVILESGPAPGESEIEAFLPEALGGDSDELEVEIRGSRPVKKGLKWLPDEVTTFPNQTIPAKLVVAQPAAADTRILLSAHPRERRLVSFPAEVLLPAGSVEVEVEILTLSLAGVARIHAAFPYRKGGDHDTLVMRIQN